MIKKIIYIIGLLWLIYLSACSKLDDFNEKAPEKVPIVVEGILLPEAPPVVWLSELSDTGNIEDTTYIPVNNAKVTLYHDGTPYNLTLFDNEWGEYSYDGKDLDIVPGDTYSLEVNYLEQLVTAETKIPYAVKNISAVVEPSNRGDTVSVLNISWESVDESYFYLFLEGDTLNTSSSYCRYSEYPFANTFYTVDTTGLIEGDTYYIIVYSLSPIYAQYYFGYDPLNSNYSYESNIFDAYGIFTGLNVNYISFVYQKDLNVKLNTQNTPNFYSIRFPGVIRY
ncbi:MAG: DUF4249 domain-containing protein [Bacteroidales bacterium]|nr:DUF4249 domain-containing protein [Bacteroidales bacterium]